MRSINHLTVNGSERITALLPESFDLHKVLSLLEVREDQFFIRARQVSGPVYSLDLKQSRKFLSGLAAKHPRPGNYNLQDFIDKIMLDCQGWQRCLRFWDPTENIFVSIVN